MFLKTNLYIFVYSSIKPNAEQLIAVEVLVMYFLIEYIDNGLSLNIHKPFTESQV